MPVNTAHPDYDKFRAKWDRIRDVIDGEDAVKAQGTLYLPKPAGQTTEEYADFKDRALFYAAAARTATGLTGAIFRKEPLLEVPVAMEELLGRLTPEGAPFITFAKRVVQEIITLGRYGVLVDVPKDGGDPFVLGYRAEQIINWRTEVVDGRPVLNLVVLSETDFAPTAEDPFALEERQRFRVLRLGPADPADPTGAAVYVMDLWELVRSRANDEGALVLIDSAVPHRRGEALDRIPFEFFGPMDITPSIQPSPLDALTSVNLSHYRTSASREEGEYFTALPVYVISGRPLGDGGDTPTQLEVGSRRAWLLEEGGTAQVLTVSSEGMSGLRESMSDKERLMAVLGARLLEDQKAGVEAAATVAMRHRGENSLLASISDTAGRGLGRVLDHAAFWAVGSEGGAAVVELNRDFMDVALSPEGMVKLVAAWQNGGIGSEVLFHNLKAGEALPDGMDLEAFRRDVEENGPDAALFKVEGDEDEDDDENDNEDEER